MSLSSSFERLHLRDSYMASENDIIVAIDFGTSRTGVVFGFRKCIFTEDLEVQPLDSAGVINENDRKTLTAILISRNHYMPIAFGQRARELHLDDKYEDDYLFRCFKMNLHNQFTMDPRVPAANGNKLPLSVIIEKSLEFIKTSILNTLYLRGILLSKNPYDIVWSLTVPAIWTDAAKSIMRKSAYKAGMIETEASSKLIIALEPECAFIAAMRNFNNDKLLCSKDKKFLIVDCGGGTIDITAYVITEEKPLKVKEIIPPDGGHLGSTLIDQRFFNFIRRFIGQKRYDEISKTSDFDIIELEKLWEECKIRFSFDRTVDENTRINLTCILSDVDATTVQQLVNDWNANNSLMPVSKSRSRAINLSFDLMMSFFKKPIEDVIDKVKSVMEKHRFALRNLNYIILAGGFCKNIHLKKRMKEEFSEKRNIGVITGKEADLLIVRGAALFASDPGDIIKTRKAKYTFGTSVTEEYCPSDWKHKSYADQVYNAIDGKKRLDVFQIHGRIGDDLEIGKSVQKQRTWPLSEKQIKIQKGIYISTQNDPFHIIETGNKRLASVDIPLDMNKPFRYRGIQTEFFFGTTEVICNVYDHYDKFIKRIPLDYTSFFE